MDILNETEQAEIRRLSKNSKALQAIKKLILYDAYYVGSLRKGEEPVTDQHYALGVDMSKSNHKIGEEIRAAHLAVVMIEGGFKRIEEYETEPEEDNQTKLGR